VKSILVVTILNLLILSPAYSQDELSGEIDKLESGQIESKSVVPADPTKSAADVESELNEEFGISPPQKAVAPEELPEDVVGDKPADETPTVEETQSPEELDEEQKQAEELEQNKKVNPPPPEEMEDSLAPVEPEVVEKPPKPQPTYVETVPDDFEERMHRIYSQFYTESTSDSAWTQIAGEKIKETYTVQPGDTLWDISVTFFGNGHYWPKVWQMNDNITNPHLVSPGYQLKFVPGQIDQAPQLNITQDTESAPVANEVATNAVKVEEPKVEAAPVIPPPDKKSVPVLTELPPSLPYIRGSDTTGFDKDGFDIQLIKPKIQPPKVYVGAYLVEEKPEGVGKIVEMNEPDDTTATLYETVFIKITNAVSIGEKLVVYSMGDKIKDSNGTTMGYPFIQEAEVQIQELVNTKDNIYKAIVTRSIGNAKVGSFVTQGSLVVGDLTASSEATPIDAEIVGGLFDSDRKFLGYQDIVYLNKGSSEGIKEGQVFTVLKSVRNRKDSSVVNELKEQVAKVKILKTTSERSTGIVINSNQFVRPGDFIGVQAKLLTPDAAKSSDVKSKSEAEPSDADPDSELDSELE
jgi:nucleoid-associated protein YgaU